MTILSNANAGIDNIVDDFVFNRPLSHGDPSQVTTMCDDKLVGDHVVDKLAFNQTRSDWDTSQVTNMCHDMLTDDIVVDANGELPRSGFGTTELVDANLGAGCGATELVDDNLGIVPPHVDWAGIPLAQDGPWLKGIDRNYIEVSSFFVLGLGPSIMWGRCLCLVVIVPYVALTAFFTRPPLRSYLVRARLWKPLLTVPSLRTYATYCRPRLVSGPPRVLALSVLLRESFATSRCS